AQALPPHLHFTAPNPHFDLAASAFRLPLTLEPWRAGTSPRRAGVSSFGFGGTNAHVVLEEAPRLSSAETADGVRPPFILPVSAQSTSALSQLVSRYSRRLTGADTRQVADICFSAATSRN